MAGFPRPAGKPGAAERPPGGFGKLTCLRKQRNRAEASHTYVSSNSDAPAILLAPRRAAGGPLLDAAPRADTRDQAASREAAAAVTELYHAHALGLTRLARVMLGDRSAAEDVVQDAFYGLYRHYPRLTDKDKALPYLRSCVLNGCRSELRRSRRRIIRLRDSQAEDPAARTEPSAEAEAITGENRQEVAEAIMRLPHRQRAVLVLRYYLDEPEAAIAEALGITGGTVRSTLHRALARLGADLKETS
jgi:RNA polymerase sigma-70 factor (sigma-E family)